MITSAGLSGGLSSSIAGGSFWAGARQGVIVAAINHLAHMGLDKSGEDDVDESNSNENITSTTENSICPDCPKNGNLTSTYNSSDGNTYVFKGGAWHYVGTGYINNGPTLKQSNSTNYSKPSEAFSSDGLSLSSPIGAGTPEVNEQNELVYFVQAVSNGVKILINGSITNFNYFKNFILKPITVPPPQIDSSHIGF